jgi:Protein of unknown function (DUF3047)
MKPKSLMFALAATAIAAALAGASPPISTDFENGIPPGWKPAGMGPQKDRGKAQAAQDPGGNHFLRISTDGSFYSIGINTPFNPVQFPIVSWRWRVASLPKNADIAKKSGDDAAARLFVTFSDRNLLHPFHRRALVYVWDSRHPVGSIIANPYAPDTEKAIVLESGPSRVGQWVPERVNLLSDYRKAFGGNPPEVKGIVCATDSDQTHSPTVADFDDLQVSTEHDATRK